MPIDSLLALPSPVASRSVALYRIIRCCDDIQYVFQEYRSPKWRHLSYHVEYDSLVRRWGGTGGLPAGLMLA